jgi:hypothetical protein
MGQFVIHVVHIVPFATRSQVADVVKIEVKVALSKSPDSNVKLSALVEQRALNVFLDHPIWKLDALFQKTIYLFFIAENLYAFALILIGRLHQPSIVLALLLRHLFFKWMKAFSLKIIKPLIELMSFKSFQLRTYDKWSGRCIKDCVPILNEINIILVIIL